jgi:hypothetical protein
MARADWTRVGIGLPLARSPHAHEKGFFRSYDVTTRSCISFEPVHQSAILLGTPTNGFAMLELSTPRTRHAFAVALVASGLACGQPDAVAAPDDVRPAIRVIVIAPADTTVDRGGSLEYRGTSNVAGNLAWTSADPLSAVVVVLDALHGVATVVPRGSGATSICAHFVDTTAAKGCATLRVSD